VCVKGTLPHTCHEGAGEYRYSCLQSLSVLTFILDGGE